MAEFTVKYNPKELLKIFESGYPFDLSLTLKARYEFVRNEFIQARQDAAKSESALV